MRRLQGLLLAVVLVVIAIGIVQILTPVLFAVEYRGCPEPTKACNQADEACKGGTPGPGWACICKYVGPLLGCVINWCC